MTSNPPPPPPPFYSRTDRRSSLATGSSWWYFVATMTTMPIRNCCHCCCHCCCPLATVTGLGLVCCMSSPRSCCYWTGIRPGNADHRGWPRHYPTRTADRRSTRSAMCSPEDGCSSRRCPSCSSPRSYLYFRCCWETRTCCTTSAAARIAGGVSRPPSRPTAACR